MILILAGWRSGRWLSVGDLVNQLVLAALSIGYVVVPGLFVRHYVKKDDRGSLA